MTCVFQCPRMTRYSKSAMDKLAVTVKGMSSHAICINVRDQKVLWRLLVFLHEIRKVLSALCEVLIYLGTSQLAWWRKVGFRKVWKEAISLPDSIYSAMLTTFVYGNVEDIIEFHQRAKTLTLYICATVICNGNWDTQSVPELAKVLGWCIRHLIDLLIGIPSINSPHSWVVYARLVVCSPRCEHSLSSSSVTLHNKSTVQYNSTVNVR